MSKTENPFASFDFTKMFDPSKMFDATKLFGEFKLPGVDADAFAATQKKNLEAIAAANKKALDGYQALAKRQAEIVQQGMEEMTAMVKESVTKGAKEANPGKQAEQLKQAIERGMGNLRELAEMAAKSNTDAFETLNKRMNESLEEMRTAFAQVTKK